MARTKKAIKFLKQEIATMEKGAGMFVLGEIFSAYKMGLITVEEERELNKAYREKQESLHKEQYPEWA